MKFTHKLVAIINKDLDAAVAMNALAHMTLGLGAYIGAPLLKLETYIDKNRYLYPNISQMPFIILKGKSNEIRKIIQQSRQLNLQYGTFLNTMTGGTYQEQLSRTAETSEDNLIFYGVALFGELEKVTEITKKLSLYK
jgi:hypothetical protein